MPGDDQKITKSGKVGDNVTRDTVTDMIVSRIARQVFQRQNGDRAFARWFDHLIPQWLQNLWRRIRTVYLDREHFNRFRDILEVLPPHRAYRDAQRTPHNLLYGVRDAQATRLRQALNSRRNVDAVSLNPGFVSQHLT